MIQLVNDLLDMSRMSTGRMDLKPAPCDLTRLIRDVIERVEQHRKLSGSEIYLDCPSTFPGLWDISRIEEVVTNLISNAIKYGRGKPIRICLERIEERFARLSVHDRGIGIRPEDQERIFDVFERAANAQDQLGHGLGLYIVRKILEAHGGTIRLQSVLGEGSTFICEFPLV
jgi:signal transduction histidine kinase